MDNQFDFSEVEKEYKDYFGSDITINLMAIIYQHCVPRKDYDLVKTMCEEMKRERDCAEMRLKKILDILNDND